jgi:hypothetical protein
MKKQTVLIIALFLLAISGLVVVSNTAYAVGLEESITLQPCPSFNPSCKVLINTSSDGQIKWGAFIAGGLRSLTNLFADGKLGVGTLRPSTGEQALRADIEGAIGAKYYCDENGNHCVAGGSLNTGGNNSTTTGINFWGGSLAGDIYKLNVGQVAIKESTSTQLTAEQQAVRFLVLNSNFPGAYIKGSNFGVYGVSDLVGAPAVIGSALQKDGYGGQFISSFNGAFVRGDKVGIYATNMNGAWGIPMGGAGAEIRTDGKSYAAYFTDALKAANSYAGYFKGKIAIDDGTQGIGKVLTSDANGNASWKTIKPEATNFVYAGPYTLTSNNTMNLGSHKICLLTSTQYNIPAGKGGTPSCGVSRNASGSWSLSAQSTGNTTATCQAQCLD